MAIQVTNTQQDAPIRRIAIDTAGKVLAAFYEKAPFPFSNSVSAWNQIDGTRTSYTMHGNLAFRLNEDFKGTTPDMGMGTTTRAFSTTNFEFGHLFTREEARNIGQQMTGPYLTELQSAANVVRSMVFVESAMGNAYLMINRGLNVSERAIPLPAQQVIPVNYTDANPSGTGDATGLTWAKVLEARKRIWKAAEARFDFTPRADLYYTVEAEAQLINSTEELKNNNYVSQNILTKGSIEDQLQGINYKVVGNLLKSETRVVNSKTVKIRKLLLILKDSVRMGYQGEMYLDILINVDRKHQRHLYSSIDLGGSRQYDAGVVVIEVAENVSYTVPDQLGGDISGIPDVTIPYPGENAPNQ